MNDPSPSAVSNQLAATEKSAESFPLTRIFFWCLILLVTSLAIAPFICFTWDMQHCWLPWARSSAGKWPWEIYRLNTNCNYPPFVPYLLTLAEKMRLALHADPSGPIAILAVKLAGIFSHVAGVMLCAIGLRKPLGTRAATMAAAAYALAIPLFINAAIWGQFDALLSLAVVVIVIAALNRKPIWCGAAAGWALSIKLQAVMAGPAIVIYVWRRMGTPALCKAVITAAIVLGTAFVPYILHGQGTNVRRAYFGAVDFYPRRTLTAYNIWYLMDGFDTRFRHINEKVARSDARTVIGPLTFKRLGLLLVAIDILLIAGIFYRHPSDDLLPFAAALTVFAFFMLATQMHGRYAVPAVAMLAIAASTNRQARWLFIGLCITLSLNQLIALVRGNLDEAKSPAQLVMQITEAMAGLVAIANFALFIFAQMAFIRAAAHSTVDSQTT